jgi:proline iminopeptidase
MSPSTRENGLFYEIHGQGTPIVVLHGGLGLDHQYLRPALDSWGDFARLVYLDHRGNGQSDTPGDWEEITFEAMTNDIESLRSALGIDDVILYGHSYGGFIALDYALRHPERLRGLVLGSTAPHLRSEPRIPPDADPGAVAAFGEILSGPMGSDDQWADTWRRALPLYWPKMDAALAADIHDRTHYSAAAWNRSAQLLADYDMSDALPQIQTPTLLLSGDQDFLTGPASHEELRAGLPNSELVVFEGAGHFPFLSARDQYRSAVESWVGTL